MSPGTPLVSLLLAFSCSPKDAADTAPSTEDEPIEDTAPTGGDSDGSTDTEGPTDTESPPADTESTPPPDTGDIEEVPADDRRWPGKTWEVTAPEEEGMDSSILEGARDYAFAGRLNTQGIVIVRHGAIVAEWYAEGTDADTLATSWSMAKSMTSALVGMSVDRGEIESIDVSTAEFFPEWSGTPNENITLRHLLEMRSGLPERSEGGGIYMEEEDQLQYSIDREAEEDPGERFAYRNEDSMLFAGILEQVTGESVQAHAQEVLFAPLQMEAVWWIDGAGHALTYCCVDATPRDYARFGLLYARNGIWQGESIVPARWVDESTQPLSEEVYYYGLHWWVDAEAGYFMALGYDDQYIYVFPEHDLVIVRNGDYTAQGDEPIRTGDNWHETEGAIPAWDTDAFLEPILASIVDP